MLPARHNHVSLLLTLFLRTEAFKHTLHHGTLPRLTPGAATESLPKPDEQGLSFRQPNSSNLFSHLISFPRNTGKGCRLRRRSQNDFSPGQRCGALCPHPAPEQFGALGPMLVVGCSFPLFPNPGDEALKPGFLDKQVVGLPLKTWDRKPKLYCESCRNKITKGGSAVSALTATRFF